MLCSALCVACEKDEVATIHPATITATEQAEMDALLREAYATAHTDAPMTIAVPSQKVHAYTNRIIELYGNSVSIALQENDMDNTTGITLIANHSLLAKKIWQNVFDTKAEHFSSSSKTEMDNWGDEKKKQGYYRIVVTVDEKGIFHGVAYTQEEWDNLNQ